MKNYFKTTSEVDVFAVPDSSRPVVRVIPSGEYVPFLRVVYRNQTNWYKCEDDSGDIFFVRENWGSVQLTPYLLKDLYVTGFYPLNGDVSKVKVELSTNSRAMKEVQLERKADFGSSSNQITTFYFNIEQNDLRIFKLKQGFELYIDSSIASPCNELIYITNLKGKEGFVLNTVDVRSYEEIIFKTTTYFIQVLSVVAISLFVLWLGWFNSGLVVLGVSLGFGFVILLLHSLFMQMVRTMTNYVFRRI